MWWFGRRSGCNRLAPVLMFPLALADSPGRAADVEPAREAARVVVSGADDPRLAPFDRMMRAFVADNRVPGAALAVTRHGRLVYARGFGYASLETAEPVRPDSLFRVASVSKPVTAAAVLRLIEQGKLAMDDKALDRLGLGPDVRPTDPRWRQITIRELLQHRGGFDRGLSGDPMFRPVATAREFQSEPPAGTALIVRSMLGKPLDFDPGTRYAYSNFGYCVLGRAVEFASGAPYGKAVHDLVLGPLGITDREMRLGRALPEFRAPGEVRYYDEKGRKGPSVFAANLGRPVPQPYGAWNLEAMDAHGAWVASAPALLKFASAFDDPEHPKLLRPATIATMFERPPGPAGTRPGGRPKDAFYACGWNVRPNANGGANTWHDGALPGTSSLLVRRDDGLDWAVLFNNRNGPDGTSLSGKIDPLIHQAADAVTDWPDQDLFKTSPPDARPAVPPSPSR